MCLRAQRLQPAIREYANLQRQVEEHRRAEDSAVLRCEIASCFAVLSSLAACCSSHLVLMAVVLWCVAARTLWWP